MSVLSVSALKEAESSESVDSETSPVSNALSPLVEDRLPTTKYRYIYSGAASLFTGGNFARCYVSELLESAASKSGNSSRLVSPKCCMNWSVTA